MDRQKINRNLLSLLLVLVSIMVVGCNFEGSSAGARFERTEQHDMPAEAITTLEVDTLFGSVTITGADTSTFQIQADLTARAPSEEEAMQIAQDTRIIIESQGSALKIYLDHPPLKNNRSVGVSFDMTMPRSIAVKAHSSYGGVELSNLRSAVQAETSFASIECSDVTGKVDLKTSYGSIKCEDIESDMLTAHTSFSSITCRDIAAPVDLKTSYGSIKCTNLTSREIEVSSSFGSIDIECSDQTGPEPHADIETSYGSIKFETPRGYSGRVKAKTSFGEIETNLPITVSGKINKDKISGNIGSGSGSLDLRTSFGSIAIK